MDGPFRRGPAYGLLVADDPFVWRRLAADQPLARTLDSADDRLGPVASHRVGGEGHAGCRGFDLALDEDGHTGSRVLSLGCMVDGDTGTESGGEDSSHGSDQGLCSIHIEDRFVLPGEGGFGQVFGTPRGADCQGNIAERVGCRQQSLGNIWSGALQRSPLLGRCPGQRRCLPGSGRMRSVVRTKPSGTGKPARASSPSVAAFAPARSASPLRDIRQAQNVVHVCVIW